MKLLSTLFVAAALVATCLPAHADSKCTLGKNAYGDTTVVLGNTALQSYSQLDAALESLNMVRSAGLCDNAPSKCALGKNAYGDITVVLDSLALQSFNNLKDAVAAVRGLREAGICDATVKSNCALGKNAYGDITVILNSTALKSSSSLKDALVDLQKMSDAGLCGEFRPNDLGSCRVSQDQNGISIYIDNGQTKIGTYRDSYVARAVFQALVNSGSCRRAF